MECTTFLYLDVLNISLHNRYCSLIQESTSDVDDQKVNVKGLSNFFYISVEYQMIGGMFLFKVL